MHFYPCRTLQRCKVKSGATSSSPRFYNFPAIFTPLYCYFNEKFEPVISASRKAHNCDIVTLKHLCITSRISGIYNLKFLRTHFTFLCLEFQQNNRTNKTNPVKEQKNKTDFGRYRRQNPTRTTCKLSRNVC